MTRRLVAVVALATVGSATQKPPFPPASLRAAMAEDVYEMVAGLELVEPVLVVPEEPTHDVDELPLDLSEIVWPGTLVLPATSGTTHSALLGQLAQLGADEAVLVTGDAPDLPSLLIGKLHRGLASAEVAVLPASDGGLVALATRCPLPEWFGSLPVGLDTTDAVHQLQQRAPHRASVFVGPGWHRVRAIEDVQRLDPGLEGWDVTRAALRAAPHDAATGSDRPPGQQATRRPGTTAGRSTRC